MRKQQAPSHNMSLSIKSKSEKLLTFLLDIVTHLFFALTLAVFFFCILRLNIFKAAVKSLVFFVEDGGVQKTCWHNRAWFYFPVKTQLDFLDTDFCSHTDWSTQMTTGDRNIGS